jgi:hypothetical protein
MERKDEPIVARSKCPASAADVRLRRVRIETFRGTCDVSAGVWWRDWLVVASDEDNVLRAYQPGNPDPIELIDLSKPLGVDPEEPEADLEGAAVGPDGTVYWIGSHGRSRKGKRRRSRERLFATRITEVDGKPHVEVVGTPYRRLRRALRASAAGLQVGLDKAARRAPEAPGGFSIEGIVFEGDDMLIAFRNPAPNDLALLVPLHNARAVIERGAEPSLGTPTLIDLGGRGIRALAPVPGGFLIVAGPYDDSTEFALYFWPGRHDAKPREIFVVDPGWDELNPEEILVDPRGDRWNLTVLSDDGGRRLGKTSCKRAKPSRRRFRMAQLQIARPLA